MEKPSDIVGHKTFDTGERDENGFSIYRHEALRRVEANQMMAKIEAETKARAEKMPDTAAALRRSMDAHQRLRELGWREGIYCPKDGSVFQVVQWGSTGIFEAHYDGEWPKGILWVHDKGDLWPDRPEGVLWRAVPETEA